MNVFIFFLFFQTHTHISASGFKLSFIVLSCPKKGTRGRLAAIFCPLCVFYNQYGYPRFKNVFPLLDTTPHNNCDDHAQRCVATCTICSHSKHCRVCNISILCDLFGTVLSCGYFVFLSWKFITHCNEHAFILFFRTPSCEFPSPSLSIFFI